MAEYDLENMSLNQLRELRGQIDRAITGFNDRKRREAMAAAEEAVKAHGFSSLADVTRKGRGRAGAARGTGGPAAPGRYANPQDASQTWSGRGRRPSWLVEGINSGKALDDYAI